VDPPDGAAPFKVTVPVELFPPTTVLGVLLNVDRTGAFTVSVAFFVAATYVAEITTEVLELTGVVVIGNVDEVLPAGIVTLPAVGTWAAEVLLLCKVTSAPPAGAAPFRVTVPVEVFPPTSAAGFNPSDDNTAAFTFKVAFLVTVPYVAEITTGVFVATGVVVIVNVVEVLPAGIVTLPVAGTCATEVLLLCRVITAPPAGAAPFRVTLPVEVFPPTSVAGLNLNDDNAAAFTFKVAPLVTP
jgi:hypothetical protein